MKLFRHKKERVTCPRCNGRRGWHVPAHASYFPPHNIIGPYWNKCWKCDGKGKILMPALLRIVEEKM